MYTIQSEHGERHYLKPEDGRVTLCGRSIYSRTLDGKTIAPGTLEKTDCAKCRRLQSK